MMTVDYEDQYAVPPRQFGRHHWNLLLSIGSAAEALGNVGGGQSVELAPDLMRCNPERHPDKAVRVGEGAITPAETGWSDSMSSNLLAFYETPYGDWLPLPMPPSGRLFSGHDDWNCLSDLVNAGLLLRSPTNPCSVSLTVEGQSVLASLDVFGASGAGTESFIFAVHHEHGFGPGPHPLNVELCHLRGIYKGYSEDALYLIRWIETPGLPFVLCEEFDVTPELDCARPGFILVRTGDTDAVLASLPIWPYRNQGTAIRVAIVTAIIAKLKIEIALLGNLKL